MTQLILEKNMYDNDQTVLLPIQFFAVDVGINLKQDKPYETTRTIKR